MLVCLLQYEWRKYCKLKVRIEELLPAEDDQVSKMCSFVPVFIKVCFSLKLSLH